MKNLDGVYTLDKITAILSSEGIPFDRAALAARLVAGQTTIDVCIPPVPEYDISKPMKKRGVDFLTKWERNDE